MVINKAADGGQEIIDQVKNRRPRGCRPLSCRTNCRTCWTIYWAKPRPRSRTRPPAGQAEVHDQGDPVSTPEEHKSRQDRGGVSSRATTPRSSMRPSLTVDLAIFTVRNGQLIVPAHRARGLPLQGLAGPCPVVSQFHRGRRDRRPRELLEETGTGRLPWSPGAAEDLHHPWSGPAHPGSSRWRTWPLLRTCPTPRQARTGCCPLDPVEEVLECHWFFPRRSGLRHAEIFKDALSECGPSWSTPPLATSFLPKEFTLAELRQVYAAVWGCGRRT